MCPISFFFNEIICPTLFQLIDLSRMIGLSNSAKNIRFSIYILVWIEYLSRQPFFMLGIKSFPREPNLENGEVVEQLGTITSSISQQKLWRNELVHCLDTK